MKKLICLLLSVVLLTAVLVACATPDDGSETAETTTAVADVNTPSDTAETTTAQPGETTPIDVPVIEQKFNSDVIILYWEDVEQPEFEVEEQSGDTVNDAIYFRNTNVEDQLAVDLIFVGTAGNFNNQKNFIQTAFNGINSGGEHDIFAGYSMTGATLAVNGYVQDLKELDYLDFDQPWWPNSLVTKATINDRLYFASGDISTNMLHFMYAVFFNKQILANQNLEDPYTLVDNGKWTYTKMFEMASNLYNDINGDGGRDIDDAYGFSTASIHYDAFFAAAGLSTVEKASDGTLIISPTFNSEKTITLVEDICAFMWEGQDGYHGSTGEIFAKENTLFTLDRSYMGLLRRDEISFEYGIVPTPKFDEAQEEYITCLAFPYTMYSVSTAAQHTEAAAASLESLASQGYKLVTPALFEITMKLKYSSDNEASRMYDIIREGVVIDIGRIFTTELQNYTYSTFRNACANNGARAWASAYKVTDRQMSKLLDNINKAFAELD